MMLELEDIVANPQLAKSVIDHLSKKTRTLQETLDNYKLRLDGAHDIKPVIEGLANRHLSSVTTDTPLERFQQHLTTHALSSNNIMVAVQSVPIPKCKPTIQEMRKLLEPCCLLNIDKDGIIRSSANSAHVVVLTPTHHLFPGGRLREYQFDSVSFAAGSVRDIVCGGSSDQRTYIGTYEVIFVETLHVKEAGSLLPLVTDDLHEQMARICSTPCNLRSRMRSLLDDGTVRLRAVALKYVGTNKSLVERIQMSTAAKKSNIKKAQKVEQAGSTSKEAKEANKGQRKRAKKAKT
ncbi:hypothetical protein PENSPDRAFT_210827 [Peniophora sp. CONT]|nr:hypothetical protein PENSPDRAFT_210827 [Peniophora sp. CONT]